MRHCRIFTKIKNEYLQFIYTIYLYKIFIQFIYTIYLYNLCIQFIYTKYLYNLFNYQNIQLYKTLGFNIRIVKAMAFDNLSTIQIFIR
jgi:hypothetical protein